MRLSLFTSLILSTVLLIGCGGSPSAGGEQEGSGPWTLDGANSHINYVTIKLDDIAENNSFRTLNGSVSPAGKAKVEIGLDSIITNVDTRDQRMREFVFKTDTFPLATISTDIDMTKLSTLAPGNRMVTVSELTVSMAGVTEKFDAEFLVTRIGANKVLVETRHPVLVTADDFDLQAGVDKLQELANLTSITPVVPVTVSLVFER